MQKKNHRHLCREDREVIYRMNQEGKIQQEIARVIGFSQSTVSKELSRNRGQRGYRPKQADAKAAERKGNKQARSKTIVGNIKDAIEDRLAIKQTPKLISGALALEGKKVSHEAIYQFIAADKAAGGDLHLALPINGKRRYRKRCKITRTKIQDRVGIEERPAIVEARLRYGDWEADLIEGSRGSGFLLSLYERKSRFGILHLLETKTAEETSNSIIECLDGLKVKTITYDNGLEFAYHKAVTAALGGKGYFCNPYHSWEKGGVENYNRLVRMFYPKGTNFSRLTPQNIRLTQDLINNRPREVLGFRTPEYYYKYLQTNAAGYRIQ
jgi:IS30 family transposase